MKYLKKFNENINSSKIEAICKKYNITNYTINDDGSIDVDGDVDLYSKKLKALPLKFRKVNGNFRCSYNQLTSLMGCPQSIGGNFKCNDNQLTTLEGAPQRVGGEFDCSDNQLTSLVGSPKSVGGGFYCYDNQLTSLVGSPQSVGGHFSCSSNQLISLEGVPQSVGGDFSCYDNKLTSLVGSPQSVGGDFECSDNQLTSLEGVPKRVSGLFLCYSNNLKNIDYLPKYYKELDISNNPISKIIYLFTKPDEYGLISNREDNELIMDFIDREMIQQDILLVNRLVEFLYDIDKPKTREELIELLKNDYTIR
ncbi:MAG: hypothetical protein M0R46_06865 [Candidatus Muirbacterium halophilum]|nr:hypothetical protein [Candidatus Muirbacterium halophilum]